MKKNKSTDIVETVLKEVVKKLREISQLTESSGFDSIFTQLKNKLSNITILPDNVIGVDGYKEHIESQFTDSMSWDNHGQMYNPDAWQIDHIIPIGSFDFNIEENFIKAFHYTNTQPLMSSDHIEKHKEQNDKGSFVIAAKNIEFP